MRFVGFNRTIRVLFYCFLVVLILGIISLYIASSKTANYKVYRDQLFNQLENYNQLTHKEFMEIEASIKAINEEFHSFESVAIYLKNDNRANGYYDRNINEADYVFPSDLKRNKWMDDLFIGAEGFEAGNFFIVHRDFVDWYYVFPLGLFSIGGILFILWIILQAKHVYKGRMLKSKHMLVRYD